MKPKLPKPRNPEARALLTGAFKQRVVKRKDKDPQVIRRRLKSELRKPEIGE